MHATTAARTADLPLVVTAATLRKAGIDPDVARRAEAAGLWTEVLPDAWLRSSEPATMAHVRKAAFELAPSGFVVTAGQACLAYGMRDVPEDDCLCLLVQAQCRQDLGPRVRLMPTKRMPATYLMGGVLVAEPVRAVIDAARRAPTLQDVRALMLAAVADCWCDEPALRLELDAGPRQGSGRCRIALDDAADGARSAPEAELGETATAAARAGWLPPFLLNPQLLLDGEPLVTPDFYIPGLGIGGELNSVRHHGSAEDLDATLSRHTRATDGGIALEHISPTRFRRNPKGFVARLAQLAEERRRLAVPEPPGLTIIPCGPLLPGPVRRRQGLR